MSTSYEDVHDLCFYAWCLSCWLYDEGLDLTMSMWYYTSMMVCAFQWCLAFDFVSMKYKNDIYAIDKGFMMIYSKLHDVWFKENVPLRCMFLHGFHT